MPDGVMWDLSAAVALTAGQPLTFRLPPMGSGAFSIGVMRLADSTVVAEVKRQSQFGGTAVATTGGTGTIVAHVGKNDGTGTTGGTGVDNGPSHMKLDLLHGNEVVFSGQFVTFQVTAAARDESWQIRLQLDPSVKAGTVEKYQLSLHYPSILPVLERRIPLSYLQQGFNDNWNGRQYISAEVDHSGFSLHIDQEVADYYKLTDTVFVITDKIDIDNVFFDNINLSVGSGPSPFDFRPGDLPFIQLDIPVHGLDANHPMKIDIPCLPDITISNFNLRFKFFLMELGGRLIYSTVFESALLDALPTGIDGHFDARKAVHDKLVKFFDQYGPTVGPVLSTWFLGADYLPWAIRHDKTSTQPDKFGLGDIVYQYIGLEPPPPSPGNTTIGAQAQSDAPLLFPPIIYTPRGAGSIQYKPPETTTTAKTPPGTLPQHTDPGDLSKVDHIVVVMMENRSFDMMLGYLSRDGGRTDIDGLKNESGTSRTQFNYYNGNFYYPEHLTNTTITASPTHSHENVKAQMSDNMGHFVSEYARLWGDSPDTLRNVMGYYGAELSTYALLAREFAVCDHWFCSHVGPTIPNRFVTLTGDLNRDSYGLPEVFTPDYKTFTPSETPTLFDHLTERGVSWTYFENRVSLMRAFTKYSFDVTNVRPYLDPVNGFHATVAGQNKIGPSGGLPSVTFIDPLFGDLPAGTFATMQDNDDAPPSDLQNGQRFISDIAFTLFTPATNPQWQRTMLVIVYDEHGGFYDHVQPPDDAVPLTGQNSGKLGPRVPAFVVSASTPAGKAINQRFEHASIAATILRRFCSPFPPSMGGRVAAAADLRGALSLAKPRDLSVVFPNPLTLPKLAIARKPAPRFRVPRRDDDFHLFLGGLSMTLGAAPQ